MTKGRIDYRDRARQLFDFSKLHVGSCYPTDIDGLIDVHNNCTVVLEYKYRNKPVPRGQRIALERLADNSRIPTIVIVAGHNVADVRRDIQAHSCPVREYYFGGMWHKGTGVVMELIERFIEAYDK